LGFAWHTKADTQGLIEDVSCFGNMAPDGCAEDVDDVLFKAKDLDEEGQE
jgi:hypothetical protein